MTKNHTSHIKCITTSALAFLMLIGSAQIKAQYTQMNIFAEETELTSNPSKIGYNYNFQNVNQLVVNYTKQWLDLPVGPKNMTLSYNKIVKNIGLGVSVYSMDFGGAFSNIQGIIGGRYSLPLVQNSKLIFGISGIVGQFQGDFSNTSLINANDPNFVSFNNERYIDGNFGCTYIGKDDKNFTKIISLSKNSINSIAQQNSNTDNGWQSSVTIINNYKGNKTSNGCTLYSLQAKYKNIYGIGSILQLESNIGIHFNPQSQFSNTLQTQNFRIGTFYSYDISNAQFNSIGIKLSINPKFSGRSSFGGMGYSVMALGNSGNASNSIGSMFGIQKPID
jgi:hypothetical protein